MNTHVNFEIAKLLKEKGYDETTQLIYMTNHTSEVLFENINGLKHSDGNNPFCSAPTIAEVVMWLYEKYKIWIHCEICFDGNSFIPKITKVVENLYPFDTQFKSPTEAYEAAITHVLNNLI